MSSKETTINSESLRPLNGIRIVSLAPNLPGPMAAAQLQRWGAQLTKIEAPSGDPLALASPAWYRAITAGQEIIRLDLKSDPDRKRLNTWLQDSDLLLTASRPSALARLGLDWANLHSRYPRLCQVAIVGAAPPQDDIPGHDLTYQAACGLLSPPQLPRTLLADLAGAQQAAGMAAALLLARERTGEANYSCVSLAQVAADFSTPLTYGLTTPGGILGGGLPGYNVYPARSGWIAIAALEPHFWQRLLSELGLTQGDKNTLAARFLERDAQTWEAWAQEKDLPLCAVQTLPTHNV